MEWMEWRRLDRLEFVDGVGVLASEGDGVALWIRPAIAVPVIDICAWGFAAFLEADGEPPKLAAWNWGYGWQTNGEGAACLEKVGMKLKVLNRWSGG